MDGLVGREREVEAIDRLLDDRSGPASAIVIQGPAGIGKTRLWQLGCQHAAERATAVLVARPTEVEADLPLVGLLDLIDSGRPRLAPDDELTAAADGPFDAMRLGRSLSAHLAALAAMGPVVVAIDDVQWLDPATDRVLRVALRHLADAPVRILVSLRDGGGPDAPLGLDRAFAGDRCTSVALGGLTVDDLDSLLRSALELRLPRPRLVELHHACAGNPLFALEIGRALVRGGGDRTPASLADALAETIGRLSPEARRAALFASASLHRRGDEVELALGGPIGLAEARDRGVVSLDSDRLRFGHPLLASVAYERALPSERRAAHRRLFEATKEPEERALHLARGADGADEALAIEMEAWASRAAARGASAIAAEVAETAGRVTPAGDGPDRRRRLFAAAELHEAAGDPIRARGVVEALIEEVPAGPERAALLHWHANRLEDSPIAELIAQCEGALREAEGDRALCAEINTTLSDYHRIVGDLRRSLEHARAAVLDAEASGDPRRLASTIASACELEAHLGLPWDRAAMARARELERDIAALAPWDRPTYQLALILVATDELEAAAPLLHAELERARLQGSEPGVFYLQARIAELELRAGRWSAALRAAREAHALAQQGGLDLEETVTGTQLAIVLAHLGEHGEARTLAERAQQTATERGHLGLTIRSAGVLGFIHLAESDPEDALGWLTPARMELQRIGQGELSQPGVVANEIEALVLVGRIDEAEQVCSFVEHAGSPTGRAWNRAIAGRGRALVAAARGDEAGVARALAASFEAHEELPNPFELARTLLAAGSIERRARRWAAARDRLTAALDGFDRLGAARWAERTAVEMARLAGRKPGSSALTETERQVAELVAEGLSNREVAGRLFLSVRTVESNLSRVYDKLGVRSRTELARRLSA
ncbi:MAG: AAA family ATPase [Candidatus Limnocylindrales bacterium]